MTLPRLLTCALALGLALPAAAQAPLAPASPEAQSDDTRDEGIHVSGAWKITVREPDGSLVDRVEFNNALTGIGAEGLVSTMISQDSPGLWSITLRDLRDGVDNSPCHNGTSTYGECQILSGTHNIQDTDTRFYNLQVSPGDRFWELVLSGSFVVGIDNSSISEVFTGRSRCDKSISPETCASSPNLNVLGGEFTSKRLSDAQVISNLQSGQIVSVEVTIGFPPN